MAIIPTHKGRQNQKNIYSLIEVVNRFRILEDYRLCFSAVLHCFHHALYSVTAQKAFPAKLLPLGTGGTFSLLYLKGGGYSREHAAAPARQRREEAWPQVPGGVHGIARVEAHGEADHQHHQAHREGLQARRDRAVVGVHDGQDTHH